MPRYSERTGLLQEYQAGPFDSAHLYLQWGGKLPGEEEWTCGLRLAKQPAGAVFSSDAVSGLPLIAPAVQAFHTRATTKIADVCKLSFVKLNVIGTDGKYMYQATNELVLANISGGSNQAGTLNQTALAVSLETGFSRGPAHRGRFFIPMNTCQPNFADGLISVADATAVSVSVDTLLGEIAVAMNELNYTPAVFSRKAGAPAHRPIIDTKVGRVMDTQRRRRRSLPENWVRSS